MILFYQKGIEYAWYKEVVQLIIITQRNMQIITITQGNSVNHNPNFKVLGKSKRLDEIQVKIKNKKEPQWIPKWWKLKNLYGTLNLK